MSRHRLPVVLVLVLACSGCRSIDPANRATDTRVVELRPTLILISLDGFRWDYLERYDAPTLSRLAQEGVHAVRGIIPSFPTKTFPNHYSIATGLYPENHGVVANTMYDPEWDAWFRISDRSAVEDSRWWGGEPIWVTAELQGQVAASFFWVGTEAPIRGIQPTYWRRFDGSIAPKTRVETALSWLDLPAAKRPTLIMLYFEHTDDAGHRGGPDSPEAAWAVEQVDGYVGLLMAGLESRGLGSRVNLIITADHGMAPMSAERVIVLSDYVDLNGVQLVDRSPVLALRPPPERVREVYDRLAGAHPNLEVHLREEMPERLHYRDHRRIPPIIGIADDGWTIAADHGWLEAVGDRLTRGDHGFDNANQSMRAVFIAHGPAFAEDLKVAPFENIHIYELMAHILNLVPAENDGRLEAVAHLLKGPSAEAR